MSESTQTLTTALRAQLETVLFQSELTIHSLQTAVNLTPDRYKTDIQGTLQTHLSAQENLIDQYRTIFGNRALDRAQDEINARLYV